MSKMLKIFVFFTCVFAVTGTIFAQEVQTGTPATSTKAPVMSGRTMILGGEVVSVNVTANQIVIKVGKNKVKNITFDVAAKTAIMKGKQHIALAEIVGGDKVMIAYRANRDKKVAVSIRVRIPKAAPTGK